MVQSRSGSPEKAGKVPGPLEDFASSPAPGRDRDRMPPAHRQHAPRFSLQRSPTTTTVLTTVDEGFESSDEYLRADDVIGIRRDDDSAVIEWRHGCWRALSGGERDWIGKQQRRRQDEVGVGKSRALSLSVSVPDPTARRPGLAGGRGHRSISAPLGSPIKMAAAVRTARVEEVGEDATDNDTTAPNSPPDLSYSKSSKSSDSGSLSESSSDGEESISTEKLSNFDSVSVEDDIERTSIGDSNLKPESRPTLKRPPPRTANTTGDMLNPSQPKSVSPPLTSKENRYPSLKGQVNGALRDQSLNLPRGLRRGFTSPSSPALAQKSRSPSPSKPFMHNGVSVTPQTLASATPRSSQEVLKSPSANGSGFFARRASWQPGGRKTAKEIEAEYNDDDDEVPDDAVLENVPMSPMPGQRRYSPQPSRSTTPSPNRRPPPSPRPPTHSSRLHSANVPKNAKRPSIPTILPNGKYGASKSPRSPRHPRPAPLQHSATVGPGSLPLEGSFSHRHRSKSWTEDLNDEAKHLSAALEEFAERESMEKHGHGSGANSAASSPPRTSTGSTKKEREPLQRSRTGLVDFPQPNRKGSAMMDALPISKEKEAALSRTRPSWLPPKCQKEEKRHLKEWEQMMARAQEAEKKRLLKENEALRSQSDLKLRMPKIWQEHILPNWDEQLNDPRTRELWWRGVPPEVRPVVWQKAIGNELELSEASFDAALKRAHALEDRVAALPASERGASIEAAWLDAIARDVPAALPRAAHKALRPALTDVLKAYMMYRSDVGYVYGTHLTAGLLVQQLVPATASPAAAFVALANLLNRPLPLAFLVHDQSAMTRIYDLVLQTLAYKSPSLHRHLTSPSTGVHPAEFLDPVFRCLFAYNLPAAHVLRVWDVFVFERDYALVRAAVAVLVRLEGRLYGGREEVLECVGWCNEGTWDVGGEEEFVRAIRDAGKVDEGARRESEALEKVASKGVLDLERRMTFKG